VRRKQDFYVKGCRDAALIAVLHGTGLRRAEVVTLELADWNLEEGCLKVRSGKGDKDRTTYLDEGAIAALMDWLALRGIIREPFFTPP